MPTKKTPLAAAAADVPADAVTPPPEIMTVEHTRDDGSKVLVGFLPPTGDWFKTCRPGDVLGLPVLVVHEHNVRVRKPAPQPNPDGTPAPRAPRARRAR